MATNTETPAIVRTSSSRSADLDTWDDAITALDAALASATNARSEINHASEDIDLIEARAILATTGNNAESRKAAVTLALADDPSYQALVSYVRGARQSLADAERRVVVLKERCRLLRSAATFAIADEPD